MHTAAHLLEHALSGELAQGRTVILVTHHVRLCLAHAAYVVELGDGQIQRAGTPNELDYLGLLEAVIEDEDLVEEAQVGTIEPTQEEFQESDVQDSLRPTRIITNGKLVEEEARAEGRGICIT
jgi:energy-coupling factor transporter ATP-binding protein EcfA2